jgi:hypothetical protein
MEGKFMETYIDIFLNTDGEKGSIIEKKLKDMGLKSTIGEHDFVYDWGKIVEPSEVTNFVDKIQSKLKGTGAILKFTTIR